MRYERIYPSHSVLKPNKTGRKSTFCFLSLTLLIKTSFSATFLKYIRSLHQKYFKTNYFHNLWNNSCRSKYYAILYTSGVRSRLNIICVIMIKYVSLWRCYVSLLIVRIRYNDTIWYYVYPLHPHIYHWCTKWKYILSILTFRLPEVALSPWFFV